ncbi:MAG: RNA chaperone Hfq [Thermodesulfobacteriota bacterium]|nr:RNA chaperone Hfq [Thermodesulfobacteriota bacterium]
MPKSQINIQDQFLNQLRREEISVIIYFNDGKNLEGIIKGFDNFSILLDNGSHNLIYKHAVAYIAPSKRMHILRS